MAGREQGSREPYSFRIRSEHTCRLVGRTGEHRNEGGTSIQGVSGGWAGSRGMGCTRSVMGEAERVAHTQVKLNNLKQLATFFFFWTLSCNIPGMRLRPDGL